MDHLHGLSRRDLQALSKRNGIRANMANAAMADALAALPAVDGIEEYVQQPAAEPAVQAVAEEEEEAPAEEVEEEKEERQKQGISPQEVIMLDDSEEEEKDEEKAPALAMGRRRATRRAQIEPVAAPATRKKAAASKAEKGDAATEPMPARATRARSQKTVSWADEEAPKAIPTSRRAAARKTCTEQEEEEEGTHVGLSEVEADVPAPASSAEGNDGAEEIEAVTDAKNGEQVAAAEANTAEAVPARATRVRSRRAVVSVAEEEAPKARRTSRRAGARKTSTEQETEEKGTQGDVCDMETAAPAPVSSDERGDGAEEIEVAVDAHNEEENEPAEEPVEAAEPRAAVPARTTRTRSKRMVVSVADEEAPKTRRTSRRAVARRTSTEKEEEEKGTQGDVSDEGRDGAEEIEATIDAQNEEQFAVAEAVPARATRARSQRTVAEEEAPMVKRTSRRSSTRRAGTMLEDEGQGQQQQDMASAVETAVAAPVSSDEGGDGAEETEADLENEDQNELVEEQSEEDEGFVADRTPLQEDEEEPVAEDCPVDSSVEEQTGTVSSEEIQHSSEDTEIVSVQEMPQPTPKSGEATQENENCTVEEETPVAEHVDSSVQQPLVDFQQCEVTKEIQLASEDAEMVSVNDVPQVTVKSGEATVQADFTNDVDHGSDENEDCTAEEEPPVEEHVESSVQELLVDVQQCEDAEMVPVYEVPQATLTSGEATEEDYFTSDADHDSEENDDCMVEEETPVADDVDSSVQEQLDEVQQCEATKEIHFASEDTEMVPVNEEVDTSDVVHASEENEVPPTSEDMLQTAAKASEKKKDIAADEVTNTDVTLLATGEVTLATDEIPQRSEAMGEGVVEVVTADNLSQATVTDDEGAVKESGFSCDLPNAPVEEDGVVAADEVPQISTTVDKDVQEVPIFENLSQVTMIDDEGTANQSGFAGEFMDVSVEDEGSVVVEEMTQSSATVDDSVQEVLIPENLSEAMVTEDEGAVKEVVTVENLSQATITDYEGAATGNLMGVCVEEDRALATDDTLHSSATEDENVEEVVTVENLSQTSDLRPVVDTARDFSDHIASPLSANVFEAATKYLSMDTVKSLVSESADIPMCMYTHSDGKMKTTEPMSVQREKEVKVAKTTAALGSISVRKLKLQLKADDVPLCIYSNSGGEENTSEPVAVSNKSEALGSLSLRKLRTEFNKIVAVAQENEVNNEGNKSTVPLDTLSLRKLRLRLKETLNAQKNRAPTRVPLGRLDENAC